MEWLQVPLTMIVGLLIRFGIPIGVTALVVWALRRLDQRWQAEADRERARLVMLNPNGKNPGCWKINDCPEEQRAVCAAYARPESPCWQVFRDQSSRLQERCLTCKVFRETFIPAMAVQDT